MKKSKYVIRYVRSWGADRLTSGYLTYRIVDSTENSPKRRMFNMRSAVPKACKTGCEPYGKLYNKLDTAPVPKSGFMNIPAEHLAQGLTHINSKPGRRKISLSVVSTHISHAQSNTRRLT